MKTIVVTGAFGFLGRYTSRLLAAEGFRVVGIGHGRWNHEEWSSWGLSAWHQCDLTLDALANCAISPYALIHLAGGASVQASFASPFKDFERSVAATANVLEYIRTSSPATRLVYPSSASVYGNASQIPIPESSATVPVSPYGVYKSLAEQMIRMYGEQYKTASSVIRFFSLYGPGLRKQLLWDACNKMSVGDTEFMGTGKELRDWLHVQDAAKLIKLAIENAHEDCPVANGGSGHGVSVQHVLLQLARRFSSQITPTFVGKQRRGDPTALVADINRSRAWGWRPKRHLADGLSEYAAWWQSEHTQDRGSRTQSYSDETPLTAFCADGSS